MAAAKEPSGFLRSAAFRASQPFAALQRSPLGFIDIGARNGVHDVIMPLAGMAAVLGFEPDQKECDRLVAQEAQASGWARYELEPSAVAQQTGSAVLYNLARPINSSLLPPNERFVARYDVAGFDVVSKENMQTVSLDDVLFGHRLDFPHWGEFIKLDTQGSELDILRGAERTLRERTVALLVEVEFLEIYTGQVLFSEVEMALRNRGFTFYGFHYLHHRSRKRAPALDKRKEIWRERLIAADAVFFKDPLEGRCEPLAPRGNHALFCCAALLGFYDFALELALATWATGNEAAAIEQFIRECASASPSRMAREELEPLVERVRDNPENANIAVGKFTDQHRLWCNYAEMRE